MTEIKKEKIEKEEVEKVKKEDENDEISTLGFKVHNDTKNSWNDFWNDLKARTGVKTREDALRELLKLAEIDRMKEIVPGRSDDIQDFKLSLDKLMTKYLSSVQAYADARDRAVDDVKLEMQTKTRTIADLQKTQEELKERIKKLEQALNTATTENNKLQIEVNKLNESIADKDTLIQSLKNSAATVDVAATLEELKKAVASMSKNPEPAEPEPEKNKKE